jgi:hypothetical protein
MKNLIASFCLIAFVSVACADAPDIPATPAAVDDIISIRPFQLDDGFEYNWSAERPLVKSGYLVVIKVDPDLVYPRQVAEPVLYVGDHTAERMNFGNESGHVVVLVPGEVDFTKAPIWFGTPELPEQVDADRAKAERKLADEAGIKAFSQEKVDAAMKRGGRAIHVENMTALLEPVASLIDTYSPMENDIIDSYRAAAATIR